MSWIDKGIILALCAISLAALLGYFMPPLIPEEEDISVLCGDDNTFAASYDDCNGVQEEIR